MLLCAPPCVLYNGQITDAATDGHYNLDHGQSLPLYTVAVESVKSSRGNTSVTEVLDDQPKTLSLKVCT